MTTRPDLGIIYISDSIFSLYALSYICKSVAAGTYTTNGSLKDIHICDAGQCSSLGSNLVYSAPNCVVNCPVCIHLGNCVTACPFDYSCVNKVCVLADPTNYCDISCRKCNVNS